ncbi:hypothetical protein BHF71_06385 [Vulcanibacillus modesticaldus]|uniref:Uncharacterized protein n=1 Tax=Vulcanibacillus modesticaldus TaxID=337097 RepID=A0A1D2YWI4_9BACI|nr:hypothetical protein [Vulcanibacillus modesticaldus]OEG00070.1 hypothetical protein BHF71_06385 [Vulcanibacillus modesticaldus]
MIINRKELARAKVNKIKNGFSAYAETTEVIELIKKELERENISVIIDETPQGCWFIPNKDSE